MNKITPQDIQKGVESVSASPESTWYKVIETLDNGDELCLAIGMGEGFDEDTVCAKLGILAANSAMSDYVWDFQMPWNLKGDGNDVWDTEISNPGESDAEWFNKTAQEMIRGFESGEIGTSLLGSACGKKKGKKKPVKSAKRVIKSMAAVSRDRLMDAVSLGDVILRDLKLNSIITDTTDYNYPMEYDKRNDIHSYYLDIRGFGEIKVLVKQDDYRTNRRNGSYSIELSPLGGGYGDKFKNFENTYYEGNGRDEFDADWNDILSQMISMDNVMTQMNSSRRPIQSMYVTEDISGNDLYTCLWSGGKDQFDSMIEDGADPDDILNACEELLFREEGNPPTMTELNDLIWFEPDTIRDYIGLSNPIESGCHGKSKKGKYKKNAVKSGRKPIKSSSPMQFAEIYNNTSNLYARIVYCDLESDVSEFNEEELIPIYDFKEQCKGYAESTNGWFSVSHDNSYEPGEYVITFTNQEGENNEFESDPYFENNLGSVKFELVCDAGDELCNYLEDDRTM